MYLIYMSLTLIHTRNKLRVSFLNVVSSDCRTALLKSDVVCPDKFHAEAVKPIIRLRLTA